jgi:hypothetical protein
VNHCASCGVGIEYEGRCFSCIIDSRDNLLGRMGELLDKAPAESIDWQARAIAAEVRVLEVDAKLTGQIALRDMQISEVCKERDEALKHLGELTIRWCAEHTICVELTKEVFALRDAADLARKIGMARANASPELWSLLDQAAALAGKATA